MYAAQIAQLEALASAYFDASAADDDATRSLDLHAHAVVHRDAAQLLQVRQAAMEAKLGLPAEGSSPAARPGGRRGK